eukprot:scaffold6388_cov62-Cylindrotheca_fusiformis.AAC.2
MEECHGQLDEPSSAYDGLTNSTLIQLVKYPTDSNRTLTLKRQKFDRRPRKSVLPSICLFSFGPSKPPISKNGSINKLKHTPCIYILAQHQSTRQETKVEGQEAKLVVPRQ